MTATHKSVWLSYLIPLTLIRDSSEFNKDIRVVVSYGKKKLLVNGIQQSGPMIEGFWNFAFSNVSLPTKQTVRSILVLGVGGGTVIGKLEVHYPDAKITAVDIDEAIIDIGRSYFGLSGKPHLTLVAADAKTYIADTHKQFDFIIADLYIGRDIPAFESSVSFIRNMKKALRPGGHILINFLHDSAYEKRAALLRTRLREEFTHVETAALPYNLFFMAY